MEVKKINAEFEYGRDKDIERLKNAVTDEEQHLCKLNKMSNGKLSSLDDGEICDIDAPVASTVTARYYKGIGAHKDNMVLQAEPRTDGISNTLTTVQKDNLVLEVRHISETHEYDIDGDLYLIRIRKLTPKECWRLMSFSDDDFHKAEAVNSNTQLYKQAGNSIVKNVLVAILGQLFDGKEEIYKNI